MPEVSTPLMRQYTAIKREHPQALLFFRLGDFYELFFEDAVLAARELEITLTSRNKEKGIAIPMCGVPYHSAENYIAKLIRKGFKVAVCDQMEDARLAKKLVRRQVTRVVTPGTAADSTLEAEQNNFLAAVCVAQDAAGFAALDLSTGEFRATEFQGPDAHSRLEEELQQLRPRELLYASSLPLFENKPELSRAAGWSFAATPLEDWVFASDYAIPLVENHFGVLSLEGFGLAGRNAATAAAGAVLHYIRQTQRGTLEHVDRIGFYQRQDRLLLRAVTCRNPELIGPIFNDAGAEGTLFRALDATLTPMGKRLLRSWMLRPSIDAGEIQARLDAVEAMSATTIEREQLRQPLDGILDIERLLSRVTLESANPRDLLALAASLSRVPQVRQTLVNAERFTTGELKQYESKVLDAQEKIVELERRIFAELRAAVAAQARRIRQTALALAQLDVLASFAHLAAHRGYTRPRFDDSGESALMEARHPVVELQSLGGAARFVPNDLFLNSATYSLLLLTGPNMGGKSTYLRQTALMVIMAQMGCFVPARSARLGAVDRIFTRIGASDNLARGRSTFMVEMTETAVILNSATPRSLLLLDEMGRGTSTFDGLALAWAAVEHIQAHTRAKTLFATHYHELTELADRLPGVKNFQVTVSDTPAGIVFLRKVEPGAASRSYGIEVAKLAGLPPELIQRAREVLAEHQRAQQQLGSAMASAEESPARVQLTMFTPLSQRIIDRLRAVEVEKLTPLEALNLLHDLKQSLN